MPFIKIQRIFSSDCPHLMAQLLFYIRISFCTAQVRFKKRFPYIPSATTVKIYAIQKAAFLEVGIANETTVIRMKMIPMSTYPFTLSFFIFNPLSLLHISGRTFRAL